jgi:hypothetical protein
MTAVLALCLLCPSLLRAATATYTFEGAHAGYPADSPLCSYVGQVTNGGITATFGSSFSLSRSLDNSTTYSCSIPPAHYVDGLAPGWFNPPSGEWAASYSWDCGDGGDIDSRSITFSTGIKFFACDLAGVSDGNAWACEPYIFSVDNGATWNTHVHGGTLGSSGSLTNSTTLEMWGNPYGTDIRATVHPVVEQGWTDCGPEYESQSSPGGTFHWDNTKTPICAWQHVEMYSSTAVPRVYFRTAGGWSIPLYIKNVRVSTAQCMNPPCEFERAGRPRTELPPLRAETQERTNPKILTARADRVSPALRSTWGRVKVIYR